VTDQQRAILFDLDGTLIDTTDLIVQCFHFSWNTVCSFNHSREALIKTFGMPLRDAMYQLLTSGEPKSDTIGVFSDQHIIENLLSAYRSFNLSNHDSLAQPFQGACEVLKELRRRGYLIAVVTSKSREVGLRGLRLCSLDDLLDAAIFLEDTSFHKPRPEPIMAALEILGTPSTSATYVGDSRHDIIAGHAAGVKTVAALWGPSPRSELEGERPNFIAESITDLLDIFN
jgi:pyrophosphatase PpaX